MTHDPLSGVDPFAADSGEALHALATEVRAQMLVLRRAFVAELTEEQRGRFFAVTDLVQNVGRIEGAQHASALYRKGVAGVGHADLIAARQARKAERKAAHVALLAQQQAEAAARKAQKQTRHFERMRKQAETPRERPVPSPTKPDWDYAPVEQPKLKRGEVVTNSPLSVDIVARAVEDLVRRRGPCRKPDVSAALPHMRAYLAAAYRHLHSSRRVQVDGWQLRPWPPGGSR